jgi:deoxyhypusine synthase
MSALEAFESKAAEYRQAAVDLKGARIGETSGIRFENLHDYYERMAECAEQIVADIKEEIQRKQSEAWVPKIFTYRLGRWCCK